MQALAASIASLINVLDPQIAAEMPLEEAPPAEAAPADPFAELEFTTENSQNCEQRVLPTLPVVVAMAFSFNDGRSRTVWQGFSMRWWYQDPFDSLLHDPALRAAMVQTFRLSIITGISQAIGVFDCRSWKTLTFQS